VIGSPLSPSIAPAYVSASNDESTASISESVRVRLHFVFLEFLAGCQSLQLLHGIVRQGSAGSFEKLGGPRGDVVFSIAAGRVDMLSAETRKHDVIRKIE
jgi:hypothetical protein